MEANILMTVKNPFELIDDYKAVLTLLIAPVNDPPVITSAVSSGLVYNITQGQVLNFASVQSRVQVFQNETAIFSNNTGVGKYDGVLKNNVIFSVSDVDASGGLSGSVNWGQVSAHIRVSCGSLLLTSSNQLSMLTSAGNSLLVSTYDPVINSEESCATSSSGVGNSSIGGVSDGDINLVIGYKGYVLRGELEMINAALSSISYQSPSAPAYGVGGQGPSSISLYVSDLGNFGLGGIQSTNMTINLYVSSEEDAIKSMSPDLSILIVPQLTFNEGEGSVRFNELINSSPVGQSENNETVYHWKICTDSNERLNARGDTSFNISIQAVLNIPISKESRISIKNKSDINANSSFYSVTLSGTMIEILSILKSASFISLPQFFHGTITVLFIISKDGFETSSQEVSSTIVIIPTNNPPVLRVFTNLTKNIYTNNNGSKLNVNIVADSGVSTVLPFSIHDPDISFLQLTDSPICGGGYCNIAVNISCMGCFFASHQLSLLNPTSRGKLMHTNIYCSQF